MKLEAYGKRLFLLLLMAAALSAQDDPKDLLIAISHKVMDSVSQLPRYMCTVTIDRAQYQLNEGHGRSCDALAAARKAGKWKRRLAISDRLRLDVAVGASKEELSHTNEMYSWVGQTRFDDRGLFDLVREGAVSTGSFVSFLSVIFGTNSAQFTYNGDRTIGGRVLAEFGYRVPINKSTFEYYYGADRGQHVRVPYDGIFLADANTLDLVRLTVHDALPPHTDACEGTQTIDYRHLHIGGGDFLLAAESSLDIFGPVDESENHAVYFACHEFVGESTLSFDPPAAPGQSAAEKDETAAGAPLIPPGLPFELAFTEPIDSTVAAAGDLILAKLVSPIRGRDSKILVKAGARVSGRIVEMQRDYMSNRLIVEVRLRTLNTEGVLLPFAATTDSGVRRFQASSRGLARRLELGPLDASQGRAVGVLVFNRAGKNYVVKSGFRSHWRTLKPPDMRQ
ncbi:MAG TPA: hypothetical protein VMH80_27220 [Bryobacteraceae bacterium]|nr:hypothetical protein [Bryobacteraceae bacterium]